MERGCHYRKCLWTEAEDKILMDYIKMHGNGHWNRIAKKTGLKRCGKSCRSRWMNYLSPSVKRGEFTEEEDDLIIRLHNLLGNRWSLIARRVPGRTDNQVKNYWNSHLSKKLRRKKESSSASVEGSNTQLASGVLEEYSYPISSSNQDHESKVITHQPRTPNVADALSLQEDYVDSLWVSHTDFELDTPSFMDFFDGHSVDLEYWPGL